MTWQHVKIPALSTIGLIVDDMEIRLHLDGPARQLGARQVLGAAGSVLDLLDEAAKQGEAELGWVVTDTEHASFDLAFGPVSADQFVERMAERITQTVAHGIESLRRTAAIPRGWNQKMVRSLRSACVSGGGVAGVSISIDGEPHALDAVVESNATSALSGTQDSVGAVIGRLDSIGTRGRSTATLWLDRGGRSVQVSFDDKDEEHVRAAWRKRVEIRGRLKRDSDGNPISIKARRIQPLQTFAESPPLASLAGLDPDYTGGLSSTEYLRKIRGETG